MKCVRKGNETKRVPDDQASVLVREKGYKYISKAEYKRGGGVPEEATVTPDSGKVLQFHMLKTPDVPEPTEGVRVLENWGRVDIVSGNVDGRLGTITVGDHIAVEGTLKDIEVWLGGLDGFWIGKGTPMLQNFEVRHIKSAGL